VRAAPGPHVLKIERGLRTPGSVPAVASAGLASQNNRRLCQSDSFSGCETLLPLREKLQQNGREIGFHAEKFLSVSWEYGCK
jgi:hypothetical protein